jgi:hypothetical protein
MQATYSSTAVSNDMMHKIMLLNVHSCGIVDVDIVVDYAEDYFSDATAIPHDFHQHFVIHGLQCQMPHID